MLEEGSFNILKTIVSQYIPSVPQHLHEILVAHFSKSTVKL